MHEGKVIPSHTPEWYRLRRLARGIKPRPERIRCERCGFYFPPCRVNQHTCEPETSQKRKGSE
jgi:hypothetical protein